MVDEKTATRLGYAFARGYVAASQTTPETVRLASLHTRRDCAGMTWKREARISFQMMWRFLLKKVGLTNMDFPPIGRNGSRGSINSSFRKRWTKPSEKASDISCGSNGIANERGTL